MYLYSLFYNDKKQEANEMRNILDWLNLFFCWLFSLYTAKPWTLNITECMYNLLTDKKNGGQH